MLADFSPAAATRVARKTESCDGRLHIWRYCSRARACGYLRMRAVFNGAIFRRLREGIPMDAKNKRWVANVRTSTHPRGAFHEEPKQRSRESWLPRRPRGRVRNRAWGF